MPSGEEEEIAERGRLPVFFNAGAARAFLAFFTNLQSHSENTYRQDDHGALSSIWRDSVAVLQQLKNSATSKH